jgi:predicted site-specific integrase-resolvase
MKLSEWSKEQGITYQTAWNMFKAGKLVNAYQLPTGTIIIKNEISALPLKTIVYARVSSSENKHNLDRQAERLISYCNAKGWQVSEVVKEVGSGLNDSRKKLAKVLGDTSINRIVVEHKDRFSRFGLNYIKLLLEQQGRELLIVNNITNDKDDLMQDFVSIITSFTARLYGLRKTKRKTEQLIKSLGETH